MIISTGMSTMRTDQEGGEGYRRGESRHYALHQYLSVRTGRIESQMIETLRKEFPNNRLDIRVTKWVWFHRRLRLRWARA